MPEEYNTLKRAGSEPESPARQRAFECVLSEKKRVKLQQMSLILFSKLINKTN